MTHYAGGKITSSHTTATKTAERVIRWADKQGSVSKISLDLIKPVRGSPRPRLNFSDTPSGFMVQVYGSGCVQNVFIYTCDSQTDQASLQEEFNKS